MRHILLILIFSTTVTHAAWSDYEEVRDLTLDAADLETLRIEAGAGSLEVTGVSNTDRIVVSALITVPGADADEAAEQMKEELVLSLDEEGNSAQLKGYFESGGNWFGDSPSIRLEVRVPARMSLYIEDGSGSMEIRDVVGDIQAEDGSGTIRMTDLGGSVMLKDGSGSVDISAVGEDVSIVDGSGSIELRRVMGSVLIEDGSGSVNVADVSGDLNIPESGSGSVNFRDVQGKVVQGD